MKVAAEVRSLFAKKEIAIVAAFKSFDADGNGAVSHLRGTRLV